MDREDWYMYICVYDIYAYIYMCVCVRWVASGMSDYLLSCGLQPTRLLCPWDSLGKNTGVGYHTYDMYIAYISYVTYIYSEILLNN